MRPRKSWRGRRGSRRSSRRWTRPTTSRGGGGGIGIGIPGVGIGLPGGLGRRGGGYPGGGRQGGGYPGGSGGGNSNYQTPAELKLRWESALPIREAELKTRETNAPAFDEK